MPSVVHGPGKRDGQAAEMPPRPSSLWECLADHADGLDVHQLKRASMLLLRVVCGWRLEDIGRAFALHKGHVSRSIDQAKSELAAILQGAGIDIDNYAEAGGHKRGGPVFLYLTAEQKQALTRSAKRAALSTSAQGQIWLLAGGLASAVQEAQSAAHVDEPEAAE